MKRSILSILILALLGIIVISCKDEDEIRIPEMLEAANVRIAVDPDYGSLRADDISNARIVFSLYSENTNIQEVEISVVYFNFGTGTTYPRTVLRTYSQGDFDAAGGAIEEVTVTSQELVTLFGLSSIDELGGGDRFDFFNVTTLTNGLVFPDTVPVPSRPVNINPGIINSSATASFSVGFTAYVACPTAVTFATGDYMLEQIAGPDDPFFGNPTRWASEVVNVTALSPIERTFEGTYFTFDGTAFNFLMICGNILVGETDAGLGCSVGLFWRGTSPPSTYDETDDSEIIIQLLDNTQADCGLPQNDPLTLRLTKIN